MIYEGLFEFVRFRYRDKKRLRTNTRTTMVSDVNEKHAHGSSRRQLHHYQNLLTLASVRLEHSGLYSCVPSSGLPNATVNLHVVKGTSCICGLRSKRRITNGTVSHTYASLEKKIKISIYYQVNRSAQISYFYWNIVFIRPSKKHFSSRVSKSNRLQIMNTTPFLCYIF